MTDKESEVSQKNYLPKEAKPLLRLLLHVEPSPKQEHQSVPIKTCLIEGQETKSPLVEH